MAKDKRRVVLVGCGMVGMSYAYAMLNQQTCDELVLIDYVKEKAEGEAMDLNHGLAFSGSHMKIWSGTYVVALVASRGNYPLLHPSCRGINMSDVFLERLSRGAIAMG